MRGRLLAVMFPLICACGGASKPAPVETPVTRAARAACPPSVPAEIALPANQEQALALTARGVQHYECAGPDGYAWKLVAPEAALFEGDAAAGSHAAGPTWTYADGSSVVGKKVAAATVDPTAIPWFRLEVASHGPQAGKLSDVTQIHRLDTAGGLAPAAGCDAEHAGAKTDVPYTARYVFYRPSKGCAVPASR